MVEVRVEKKIKPGGGMSRRKPAGEELGHVGCTMLASRKECKERGEERRGEE